MGIWVPENAAKSAYGPVSRTLAKNHNSAISPYNLAIGRMMMAIACGKADFLFLFVLIWPDYEVAEMVRNAVGEALAT